MIFLAIPMRCFSLSLSLSLVVSFFRHFIPPLLRKSYLRQCGRVLFFPFSFHFIFFSSLFLFSSSVFLILIFPFSFSFQTCIFPPCREVSSSCVNGSYVGR
ncbi:hypothetical protein F5Y14DRAFT_301446 [Nemania sp. NC0429]|nr:hypothetical protein F5Y14DRAFT_301446 [Nemania sp. NC0429]